MNPQNNPPVQPQPVQQPQVQQQPVQMYQQPEDKVEKVMRRGSVILSFVSSILSLLGISSLIRSRPTTVVRKPTLPNLPKQ